MQFNDINVTDDKTYLDMVQKGVDNTWKIYETHDYKKCLNGLDTFNGQFNQTTTLTLVFGEIQYGYCILGAATLYLEGYGDHYKEIALELFERVIEIYSIVKNRTALSEWDFDTLQIVEAGFAGGPFLKGLLKLYENKVIDETSLTRFLPIAESMMRFLYRLPEWGGFNRCGLRYTSMMYFAKLFPKSQEAEKCEKMSHMLAEESLGRWTIEDTAFYNGIWLVCLMEYLEETGKWNAKIETVLRYYSAYYTHIQTPEGGMPDYGDSHPREFGCTALGISFLEWAASKFSDGRVKYAAMKLVDFGVKFYGETGGAYSLWMCRAYLLSADVIRKNKVEPILPPYESGEVMEDLIGKKICFRNKNDDTYFLLNYRDEGNFAAPARLNMLHTIPAPAEKNHHGHADENSIVMYYYKGKPLLFDGGYRDAIATDGHYRADFYHNRVVMRNGRIYQEKGLLEFSKNIGTYLKVNTEKIYYHVMNDVEISRTSVDDTHHHTVWDRTVCHFVDKNVFAVIDSIKATKQYEYTFGPMWFSGEITKDNETSYFLKSNTPKHTGPEGTEDLGLRVAFVRNDLKTSVESIRRVGTDGQQCVSQYFSEFLLRDEYVYFVTLLMPEQNAKDKARNDLIIASAESNLSGDGKCMSLKLDIDESTYTVAHKMDLEKGIYDLKTKPSYGFEAGKATYGDFTTDALLAVFKEDDEKVEYEAAMVTRIDYMNAAVFKAPEISFGKNDLTNSTGSINYYKWKDRIVKK
ncbi:MAG: heparinase II/III family protein [Clostridia bacterium]|nr:heparinase II/III family protein [Clostridia bacterium]